ncbi:MAG TPA: lipase secretion chaperone [Polyangia bacterium]|jgi:hypothetical protein|nr:lipase secretion chaperone [Polyangia bacterium]
MRALGLLVGLALLGLALWRYLAPSAPLPRAPLSEPAAHTEGASLDRGRRAGEPAAPEESPEAFQARLLLEQARQRLLGAYQRASGQADFALAPGRVLRSLLEKRCGLLERHEEAWRAYKDRWGLTGQTGPELCRSLLFAYLKDRLGLPEDVTQAAFFARLDRIDAEYERLVLRRLSPGAGGAATADAAFLDAYERFREARRGILGSELDRKLLGLADDVLHLPHEVQKIVADPRTPAAEKLAAYQKLLAGIEGQYQVLLSSVLEPVELAKLELRIREAEGELGPEERRAVIEKYAGPDYAARYVQDQQEQADRNERLKAFNQERDQMLAELRAAGLSPEEVQKRMPEIDRLLLHKYRLE